MRIVRALRDSRLYRGLCTLQRWAEHSVVVATLGDERVLKALVAVFVVGSVLSVLASNLGAGLKFLSFLLVFAVLGSATKRRLE
jgi:hypothetical protein